MHEDWVAFNRRKLLRMTAGGLTGSLFLPLVPIRLASGSCADWPCGLSHLSLGQ